MDNETFRNFNMYIHSTFRNVGLFTSLAYGSLAYSRIYRGHNVIYDILLICISMAFITIAFIINWYLHSDIIDYAQKHKANRSTLTRWTHISTAVMGIHTILILLACFTLYRSLA